MVPSRNKHLALVFGKMCKGKIFITVELIRS